MLLKTVVTAVAVAGTTLVAAPAHAAAGAPAKWNDFNGDGRRDITASGPGKVRVYYSGNKKTQQLSGPAPLASADFDRDGYADLVVPSPHGIGIIYGSRKGLTKKKVTLTTGSAAEYAAVGDFNRNGRPDLVVTAKQTYWLFKDLGKGRAQAKPVTVTWRPKTGYVHGTIQPVVGDFTGDGRPDLVFNSDNPDIGYIEGEGWDNFDATILLAEGSADGGLGVARPLPHTGGQVAAAGDFNGDGRADLVVATYVPDVGKMNLGTFVMYGGPGGLGKPHPFNEQTPGLPKAGTWIAGFGDGISVGDVNRDGRSDLAASDPFTGQVWVLFGSRKGLTTKSAQLITEKKIPGKDIGPRGEVLLGDAVSISDVTGDHWPDLVISARNRDRKHRLYVLRNHRGRITNSPVRIIPVKGLHLTSLL